MMNIIGKYLNINFLSQILRGIIHYSFSIIKKTLIVEKRSEFFIFGFKILKTKNAENSYTVKNLSDDTIFKPKYGRDDQRDRIFDEIVVDCYNILNFKKRGITTTTIISCSLSKPMCLSKSIIQENKQ